MHYLRVIMPSFNNRIKQILLLSLIILLVYLAVNELSLFARVIRCSNPLYS